MDDIDVKARAARNAQKKLLDYTQRAVAGALKPDLRTIERLVRECEDTFGAWKGACVEFNVH